MRLTLNITDLRDIVLEKSFHPNFGNTEGPIGERITHLDEIGGIGTFHEIFYDGIHIAYGDLCFRRPIAVQFESDFETVEMHFDLMGDTQVRLQGHTSTNFCFSAAQHNIIYAPGIKGKLEFNGQSNRTLEINMAPKVFRKIISGTTGYEQFLLNMEKQNPAYLSKFHMPITAEMLLTIDQIIHNDKTGIFKKLYIESKVMELLMLQLEQFAANLPAASSINANQFEKMQHAREIIVQNPAGHHSLKQISLQIGTNEFSLKKGFKEVFGTTVFAMLNDVRMENAKNELLRGGLLISEISTQAGYKNQTHFSAAFKKRYGFSPSALKPGN